ncbi:MAG: hypothetical protein EBQ92_10610 [Proteobacteria bacterium]|nr:hypothetical protein [Pseudomonadota bacterium]
MKITRFVNLFICLCTSGLTANAMDVSMVKGATLTEVGDYVFDAVAGDGEKTAAQKMIDRSFSVGVRHIVLTPRAVMTTLEIQN